MSRPDTARYPGYWPLIAAVLCLAGCAQRAPEPPAIAAQGIPPKLTVVASDQHHVIYVNPRTGRISTYSRPSFDAFLAQVSSSNPEAIHLQLRGPVSPAALAAISDIAVEDGVPRPKISMIPTPGVPVPRDYDVAIQVETVVYTVIPPSCPRTSHTTIGDNDNTPSSDYGCATVSNLSAQIADPRDLVRGEPFGGTESVVTTSAITRLRTEVVKPYLQESNTTSGGGS